MLYIFMVLGCWLKVALPQVGNYGDYIWLAVMWGVAMIDFLIIAWALADKAPRRLMRSHVKRFDPKRVWLIFLSALLAGHAWTALITIIAGFGVVEAFRYKTLGNK